MDLQRRKLIYPLIHRVQLQLPLSLRGNLLLPLPFNTIQPVENTFHPIITTHQRALDLPFHLQLTCLHFVHFALEQGRFRQTDAHLLSIEIVSELLVEVVKFLVLLLVEFLGEMM